MTIRRTTKDFNSEMLAKIIDGSSIASFVIDRQHRVTHWNTAMEALSGIKREDILATSEQWRAFYTENRPTMADLIIDGARNGEIEGYYLHKAKKSALIQGAYEAEEFFPALGSNGKWLRITASPIRNNQGTIVCAFETLEDITQRKVTEENLRYYLKAITSAQEEERKRIARELHDDTAQMLGSLSRQLDNFIRKKSHFKPEEVLFLKEILAQINAGAQNVHRFSQALRLSVLDDFGLIPALRSLTKVLQEGQEINSEFKVVGEAKRYSPEVETALFRITQEAVNNIGKHAQASEASVVIEFLKDKIGLTIRDNGKGFDLTESVGALPRSGKLGLAGIQERASLLGGIIKVDSSPGKGTSLSVEIPLE